LLANKVVEPSLEQQDLFPGSFKNHKVFQECEISGLKLCNRIVMAPMTRRFANDDGIPTEEIVQYYTRRSKGEVGLIISEGTGVDAIHAYDSLEVPRFDNDEQIAGWKRVVDSVHINGPSKFVPQLWHCGPYSYHPLAPITMTDKDFIQVREAFVKAAKNAKAIGCDAIELHGAHGYLLDSFIYVASNTREDAYGGSLEKRMKFPLEIVTGIRNEVGQDFPIIYRFSQWTVADYKAIKFNSPDELSVFSRGLASAGVNIFDVSTRNALNPAFPSIDNNKTLVELTRELSNRPCIAVGKVAISVNFGDPSGSSIPVSNPRPYFQLIENNKADLLAAGRSILVNPNWVQIVRDQSWQNLVPYSRVAANKLI